MNICQSNSHYDAPRGGHDCLLLALATLGLFVFTPRVAADCACGINVPQGTLVNIFGDLTTNCMKVDGTLIIVNGTLTLNGAGCSTSKIDGTVVLQYTSRWIFGSLAFTTNDHLLKGNGAIVGENSASLITIGSDNLDLTSNITIEGALQIRESGSPSNTSFVNGGLVHANAAGTLEITTDSLGVSSGNWQLSNASGKLRFNYASSTGTHSGAVTVSAGTLDVGASFCTTGDLTFTGGTIDIAAGKSFTAGGSCP